MTKTTHHTEALCQYIGTGTQPTCTHSALEGQSYCEQHYAIVYKVGTARGKRHKEVRTVNKVRLIESLFNEAVAELEAEGFDCYGDSELTSKLEAETF